MNIRKFFEGIKTELTHVTWPTTSQVIYSTITIIVVSVLVGYMLGFFDVIFTKVLEFILNK
ncbi:MAG: preprotein translocase subunit SecE [Candidatus Pacebacteria bacterium]|nr:preprotein translocase subunit SecE [Candidatus Paceibacterota bacterium]